MVRVRWRLLLLLIGVFVVVPVVVSIVTSVNLLPLAIAWALIFLVGAGGAGLRARGSAYQTPRQDSGSSTIRLYGEFGLGCAEQVQGALGRALGSGEHEPLVLDLRGLTFIDSTGMRMLISVNGTARSDGFGFAVLCKEDGPVRRVLRETGLDDILPVIDSSGAVPATDSPV